MIMFHVGVNSGIFINDYIIQIMFKLHTTQPSTTSHTQPNHHHPSNNINLCPSNEKLPAPNYLH